MEELLKELTKTGWLVTDWYQINPTSWNCALRRIGDFSTAYGRGETALDALNMAVGHRQPKMEPKKKPKVERVRI